MESGAVKIRITSAMMITSIVQVELIAAQNQIQQLGYMSCSVTTDGFISNCPESVLKSLNLYGLRRYMEAARLYLTGDNPEIWEIKHAQDDLVNFTMRGNVSQHWLKKSPDSSATDYPMVVNGKSYAGVCAHNSTKSGYESDSYEDRLWLMTQVLGRTGTVDYTDSEWTSFKDLVEGKPFVAKTETRHVHMDFDVKRKPSRESFRTDRVTVEGKEYEIAHFDTEPFQNIEESRLYRAKKKLTDVLRTEADWNIYWSKLTLNATGAQPRNMDWAILNSCIIGHRSGRWIIPGLEDKSTAGKCAWINKHNTSGKQFGLSDWKNARRPERQVNMLPLEMIRNGIRSFYHTYIPLSCAFLLYWSYLVCEGRIFERMPSALIADKNIFCKNA